MKAATDVRPDTGKILADTIKASLSETDDVTLSAPQIDAAAAFLADALEIRGNDAAVIRMDALPESGAGDSAHMRGMRLAIVNSDMPFLVDSISGALAQQGHAANLLIHPILPVRRDGDGQLIAIGDGATARRESVVYIEADRADAKERRALEKALATTLDQVRATVTDWRQMIEAMQTDCNRLGVGEGADLLRWFLKGYLTQLGHEVRERDGSASVQYGICRTADEPLLASETIAAAFKWFDEGHEGPLILKSNRQSRVHRRVLVDLFIIPIRSADRVTALSIHAGLWTSAGLSAAPADVPLLRGTLSRLMNRYGYDPAGHAAKTLEHGLTYLPHDLLLGLSEVDRDRIAMTAMSLGDRPRPALELAAGGLERHLFAFVWLPRDDMTTRRRDAIVQMIGRAANAPLLGWSTALEEGGLALLRCVFDLRGEGMVPDSVPLDAEVKQMVRGWLPAVEAALVDLGEARRAPILAGRYAPGFPPAYREGAGPAEAAVDILRLQIVANPGERGARIYRNSDDDSCYLRLKLYSRDPISLSEAVPALENFGFRVLEELSTPVGADGAHGHIQKFVLALDNEDEVDSAFARQDMVEAAIASVLDGSSENDRFNDLLITAGLNRDAVVLLRALYRYLRQTGIAYGLSTVVDALRRAPLVTGRIVELFGALHDPNRAERPAGGAELLDRAIEDGLAVVTAIDDDRILRLYHAVVHAVLRTNIFTAAGRSALAFKIDSALVPGLPAPVPWREIWVYSPRVEGIHLRAGPIARGGLRWSDRRDDFRTEILGLMKAQRVKNAVIVPTGAKGGFYPKHLPDPSADRDAWLAEGTECYRIFIRALLSVTDNVVKGKVKHPKDVVVRDGVDPYFVVAADKGTATFSDIANGIALEQDFWLGDAFASGGSNGYDHKAMGITARGAWVSVQRHFLEMGVDVQSDPVRVIGVGDMSGDVFGNGMLLSRSIRLVAAFDHRHIFIDPNPDAAASWQERDRLFKLPRSSWDDYDRSLISAGGGVFSRSMKSIPLSPEMRALVGTDAEAMEPTQFISALLRAEADLLWFGGIGTYIKAAAQSNSDAGDSANDRLRINAEDLRVKVIGEGANLGVTQAARIAFALRGGRINTDFIDNSAGVDCSDNEVNIKIALNKDVRDGTLKPDDRDALLKRMTDSVAAIVLEDNRLQSLGLSIAQAGGADDVPSYIQLIEGLEATGRLDRHVEGLIGDQELVRRAQEGFGLTRPELAVLSSTAKLALQAEIETSPLSADPLLLPDLTAAFPVEMRTAHAGAIAGHQLHREIVATKLANRIVNRLGMIMPFGLAQEEGCTLADVATAFVVAEALFDMRGLWERAETEAMPEQARILLFRQMGLALIRQMGDIHRCGIGAHAAEGIERLKPSIAALHAGLDSLLTPDAVANAAAMRAELTAAGVPDGLADDLVRLLQLDGAIGIADLAGRRGEDAAVVTASFTQLGGAVGLDRLQAMASRYRSRDPWERLLVAGVLRDVQAIRLSLFERAGSKPIGAFVNRWLDDNAGAIFQYRALLERAQMVPPTAAMIAELAARARALLSRS